MKVRSAYESPLILEKITLNNADVFVSKKNVSIKEGGRNDDR